MQVEWNRILSDKISKVMCGKVFTAVAYGLAIAKVALKIQATESPKYDVFVNLVWGPHLLNQSRILGKRDTQTVHYREKLELLQKNSLNTCISYRETSLQGV